MGLAKLMFRFLPHCYLIYLVLLIPVNLCYAGNQPTIKIAVLAYDGKTQAMQRWQPTAEYLDQFIADYHFQIETLTHSEIEQAILKKNIHFLLTNPGHYVRLEAGYGITRIVTFKSKYQSRTLNSFGAVILTRSDSAISQLSDLKNKKFAAVGAQAFGGYQMAQRELMLAEPGLFESIDFIWLGFPQKDIVQAVLTGEVDAGTVRTGVIENLIQSGSIQRNQLRILAEKKPDDFPLSLSTELYPEWPLAQLTYTPKMVAEQVALALLQMPADSAAAVSARGAGWTIPADYSRVHELFRFLKLPPYQPQATTLLSIWTDYKSWLLFALMLLILGLTVLRHLYRTNADLRKSRLALAQHQGKLEEVVRERTRELQELNQQLERDNQIITRNEAEYRAACETLQAMTVTSTRKDLTHQQRLQNIVDIGCHHMQARKAVLSSMDDAGLKVCAVSPIDDGSASMPLIPELVQQAIGEEHPLYRQDISSYPVYIAYPVKMAGSVACVIELVLDQSFEMGLSQDKECLQQQVLNLIIQWASNELLMMRQQEEEAQHQAGDMERFSMITPREYEVLALMASGKSNKLIAQELGISTKTVELHRSNLLKKTGIKSSIELVKTASDIGVLK